MEDGHPHARGPAALLRKLDMKQEINTQDTSFPFDLLQIPAHVKTEGGKICTCSVQKLDPRHEWGELLAKMGGHSFQRCPMVTFFASSVSQLLKKSQSLPCSPCPGWCGSVD